MGIPNILGTFTSGGYQGDSKSSGAMYPSSQTGDRLAGGQYARGIVNFDASKSNTIYGNSNTVTPQSQSTLHILKY